MYVVREPKDFLYFAAGGYFNTVIDSTMLYVKVIKEVIMFMGFYEEGYTGLNVVTIKNPKAKNIADLKFKYPMTFTESNSFDMKALPIPDLKSKGILIYGVKSVDGNTTTTFLDYKYFGNNILPIGAYPIGVADLVSKEILYLTLPEELVIDHVKFLIKIAYLHFLSERGF